MRAFGVRNTRPEISKKFLYWSLLENAAAGPGNEDPGFPLSLDNLF
jgi:hypothetical protein